MGYRKLINLSTDVVEDGGVCRVNVAKLPDQDKLEFYQHYLNREVFWEDDISEDCLAISEMIMAWNREDAELDVDDRVPIRLFINTDGGSAVALMHLIDVISLSKTPVYTIGMAKVYSAGCYLLMAGHKRFVFPNTEGLMHDGGLALSGSMGKVQDTYDHSLRRDDRLRSFVLSRTKIRGMQYNDHYRQDWYVVGQEMVDLGIADQVITDLDDIL